MRKTNETYLKTLFEVECPDSTYHPKSYPLVLDKGLGSMVWDVEGKPYIDLCAGFGSLPLGHNHPTVAQKLSQEGALTIHQGLGDVYPGRAKVDYLEALIESMPPHLTRGCFAVTGGQAVELALKTAMLATKGSGFIAFEEGYHGLDLGVLPVTHREGFRSPFAQWAPLAQTTHLPFGCDAQALRREIGAQRLRGHKTAAILVEPIQGRAGVRAAPVGWLRMLRQVADEEGVLLIFDEVFTGLGRTGRMSFGGEVPCDLLCLGKALGGGMPLSACLGREGLLERAWPLCEGEALHTGTFFGHNLSCLIGHKTFQVIQQERLWERAEALGVWFRGRCEEILAPHPSFKEARGEGLMLGIEFHTPGLGALLMDELRGAGVIAIPSGATGSVLSVSPALNIPQETLEIALNKIEESLSKICPLPKG